MLITIFILTYVNSYWKSSFFLFLLLYSSILDLMYQPQDYYFKKAKKAGYPARSVYKLKEIDERFHIFHHKRN